MLLLLHLLFWLSSRRDLLLLLPLLFFLSFPLGSCFSRHGSHPETLSSRPKDHALVFVARSGETCIPLRPSTISNPLGDTPQPPTCYNNPMPPNPTDDEANIRAARAHSNRSIARRNLLGIADSLAENFVAVIGDGTFVPTRVAYLKLFKQGFDTPKTSLTYERLPDRIEVSSDASQASEQGHWIATTYAGTTAFTGTYAAMWRNTKDGWKLRSELFITLTN